LEGIDITMAQETRSFKRAPVTKILIAEAVRTTHDLPRGEGQYEAQTYITPTGRTISKVMISGVAVEKGDVGKDQSMWRLRVSDPSGAMHVFAGTYQPEAAQVIARLEIPAFVAVVGKLNLYKPEEGSVIVSLRPDSVSLIDSAARDNLILDASLSTLRSIRKTSDDKMKEMIAGIYGDKDGKEAYILVARQAIESLEPVSEKPGAPAQAHDETREATPEEKPVAKAPSSPSPPQASAPTYPGKVDTKKEKALEKEQDKTGINYAIQTVQDVIFGLLQEKGTIKYQDIPDMLKAKGVNPNMVDWTSAVKRLMQEGMCCEPRLGTLRVV
jgi:RPA family protein